jgi:hypothetical protein
MENGSLREYGRLNITHKGGTQELKIKQRHFSKVDYRTINLIAMALM